jgi:hypothetical protein
MRKEIYIEHERRAVGLHNMLALRLEFQPPKTSPQ